jgi:hypothetical protein
MAKYSKEEYMGKVHEVRIRFQRSLSRCLHSPLSFTKYHPSVSTLVAQVVELLQTFMTRTGDMAGLNSLQDLNRQLDNLSTEEKVDEVQSLLQNFVGLSIEQMETRQDSLPGAAAAAASRTGTRGGPHP